MCDRTTNLAARFYRACRRVAQARSVVLVAHPPPAGARLPGVNGSMRPHDNDEDRGAGPAAGRAPARAWRRAAPARPPRAGAPPPTEASPPPCRTRARPAARSRRAAASSGSAPARSAPCARSWASTAAGACAARPCSPPPTPRSRARRAATSAPCRSTSPSCARKGWCWSSTGRTTAAARSRRPGPGTRPASTCGRRWSPPPSCGPCSTGSSGSAGRRWPSCAWRSAPCCSPAPPWPRRPSRTGRRWRRWRGTGGRCAGRGGGSTTRPPPRPSSRRCGRGSGRCGPRSRRSRPRPGPPRWRTPWRTRWARPRIRHPGTSFRASIRPNQTPLRRRTDSGRPGRSGRRSPTTPISPWTRSRTARSRPASGRTGSASPPVAWTRRSSATAPRRWWRRWTTSGGGGRRAGCATRPACWSASCADRPTGSTGPHGLHAAGRWRPPLTPGEARALAAELAPAHDPRWLWRRFEGYRRRRGVELRDERRAFAGFARKCQRDRAGGAPWA